MLAVLHGAANCDRFLGLSASASAEGSANLVERSELLRVQHRAAQNQGQGYAMLIFIIISIISILISIRISIIVSIINIRVFNY